MSDYDGPRGSPELVRQVTYDIQSNSSLGVESTPMNFSYPQADRSSIVLSFKVECAENYYGQDCSQLIYDCSGVNCGRHGHCVDGVGNYTCICNPGYTGENCDVNINKCQMISNNCSGRGQCSDGLNAFTCACDVGYTGKHCEIDINECESLNITCGRHGRCVDKVASYTCVCNQGFTGSICSEITHEPRADKTPNLTAVLGGAIGSLVVLVLLLLLVVAAMALVIRAQRKKGEHHSDHALSGSDDSIELEENRLDIVSSPVHLQSCENICYKVATYENEKTEATIYHIHEEDTCIYESI